VEAVFSKVRVNADTSGEVTGEIVEFCGSFPSGSLSGFPRLPRGSSFRGIACALRCLFGFSPPCCLCHMVVVSDAAQSIPLIIGGFSLRINLSRLFFGTQSRTKNSGTYGASAGWRVLGSKDYRQIVENCCVEAQGILQRVEITKSGRSLDKLISRIRACCRMRGSESRRR
jgi:hypothetical protein